MQINVTGYTQPGSNGDLPLPTAPRSLVAKAGSFRPCGSLPLISWTDRLPRPARYHHDLTARHR